MARRTGRGWPTIALLGVAYSLIEEGLADQMLFNPAYDGTSMLEKAYVPAWGTGAWVILSSVTVHAIWSVCVSIAMVEALTPRRATPWLGTIGLAMAASMFALGVGYVAYANYQQYHFMASPTQLIVTAAVIVAIIAAAFAIHRRPRPRLAGRPPNPRLVGATSLAASSLLMVALDWSPWVAVASWLVIVVATVALIAYWSQHEGWGPVHQLAAAGGALLTYAWIGFVQEPVAGSKGTIHLVGHIVFALSAVALLAAAIRSLRREVHRA